MTGWHHNPTNRLSKRSDFLFISFVLVVFAFPTTLTRLILKPLRFDKTTSTLSQQAHIHFSVNLKTSNLKPIMTTNSFSVNEERAKHYSEHQNRESHGLSSGIDENTSMDDVRAPNVFERAKEEFQALSEVLHHKRKVPTSDIRDENQIAESIKQNREAPSSPSERKAKAANIFVKAKEEIKGFIHHDKSKHHDKETHGRNDDISENTPTNEVKGPNVFERVKEELEAVFQAIHPK